MDVEFTHKFKKQFSSCKDKSVKIRIKAVIQKSIELKNLSDIPGIKKLKGSKNCYRIRIGDYRIGLWAEKNTIIFATLDHRSQIYRYFP